MSITRTNTVWRGADHFEPDEGSDPQAQRRLRGQLEQIDYAAYVSNRELIGQVLGPTDQTRFQRLAVAAAMARAGWAKMALSIAECGQPATAQQIAKLAELRRAYEELAEAYDGLRRMVERGYVTFAAP
jgi:hypothetical protein